VIVGQSLKLGEQIGVDFAATRTNAAHKSFPRGAVRPVLPAGVLRAWTSLPSLQDPLQRIVNDPPVFVELGYEAIGGVR
jgi:hypothetical protein